MASSVATPLEREFSTIAGIDSMISTSALGTTQVTMQFVLDRDIDAPGRTCRRRSPAPSGDCRRR
jgi:HAE1 family hydrophobic/amphiphilic exporter-1